MAQAKHESTTRHPATNKKPVTALIDAHRKAMNRCRDINGALERLPRCEMPGVPIPEVGAAVKAHSKEDLETIIAGHCGRHGLSGWPGIEFRARMKPIAAAVEALELVSKEWRDRNRIDAQEAEQAAAQKEERKAWAALVKHVKSQPSSASAVARYLSDAAIDGAQLPAWKQSQLLAALAGKSGR